MVMLYKQLKLAVTVDRRYFGFNARVPLKEKYKSKKVRLTMVLHTLVGRYFNFQRFL